MPMPPAKRTVVEEAAKTRAPALGAVGNRTSLARNGRGRSPVLALQLAGGAIEDDGRRWSPRAAMGLAGGASLLVWGAVALAVGALG